MTLVDQTQVEVTGLQSIDFTSHQFDISRSTTKTLVRRGELEAVRVGRQVRITKRSVAEFIRRNAIVIDGGELA